MPKDPDCRACKINPAPCPTHIKLSSEMPRRPEAILQRLLPDGREACLLSALFTYRILIGPPGDMGGDEEIMFVDGLITSQAEYYFRNWDGYGVPERWARWRVGSNIYKPGPDGKPLLRNDT